MPHLLLVDDDLHLGQIVGILCRRAGHRLTHALDVAEAWKFLHSALRATSSEGSIDLALLDVHLPGESGVVLCQRIRAEPALQGLPVALFTHQELVEDIAAGWEAGADFVLAKDLVTDHAGWQQRLQEILSASVGHPGHVLLRWTERNSPGVNEGGLQISDGHRGEATSEPSLISPGILGSRIRGLQNWLEAVNEVLYNPASHLSGVRVVAALIQRAVQRVHRADPSATWLTVREGRVVPGSLPPVGSTLPQGPLRELILSLAEQVWQLLGGPASEPTRRALAQLAPGLFLARTS
jgi:CheY-like chemotaxis protein